MFLDKSYFNGELYLPNLSANQQYVGQGITSLKQASQENLEWFIAKYETEFLEKLLGKELYNNFRNNYNENENNIWKELYNAIFLNIDGFKFSPCANYVYVYINMRNNTQTTQKGEKKATTTNAVNVSNSEMLIRCWLDMKSKVKEFYCFLFENWYKYKDYTDKCFRPYDFGTMWYF